MMVPNNTSSWFTPQKLLFLFCSVNMLVYMDRGLMGSNGVNGRYTGDPTQDHGIQGDFQLTDFEDGILASAFMVGLLVASPIFAEACKHHNAMRLMGIGLGIWMAATFGCALSIGFWSILFFRMLVGVGEASFVSLAAPCIDDRAPAARKTMWLATFYLCIPAGFAFGYVLGGIVHGSMGWQGDWRMAFVLESMAMLPFVLFLLLVRNPIDLAGSKQHRAAQTAQEFITDVAVVVKHAVFSVSTLGYAAYTGVLGVYAYWGPKAGCAILQLESSTADISFGAVTVLTGIAGTMGGGLLLDIMGSTLPTTLGLCSMAVVVGGTIIALTFAFVRSVGLFFALFAVGELALFCIQAPVNAVGLWSVPSASRPLAMSLVIIVIHVLGDVPSPSVVGAVQQAVGNWRVTMSATSLVLLASGAIFGCASLLARTAVDYRRVAVEAAYQAVEQLEEGGQQGGLQGGSMVEERRGEEEEEEEGEEEEQWEEEQRGLIGRRGR